MELLGTLGALLGSVASGGATGLLGILIQRFFDLKSKGQEIEVIRLNHANALELKRVELAGQAQIASETRAGIEAQAQAQERSAIAQADSEMMVASVQADRAMYLAPEAQVSSKIATFLMGMVDWVRGMTRPILTAYLVVITHLMFNWAMTLASNNGQPLTTAELREIIMLIVSTLLYLATVAVVWWFGTRPPRAPVTHK